MVYLEGISGDKTHRNIVETSLGLHFQSQKSISDQYLEAEAEASDGGMPGVDSGLDHVYFRLTVGGHVSSGRETAWQNNSRSSGPSPYFHLLGNIGIKLTYSGAVTRH